MSLKNLSVKTKIPNYLKQKLVNKKINQIYHNFEKSLNVNKAFIVAVSGGPDSLALAFLAKMFSIKNKITSRFFIIDHKLRKESSKEARTVKNELKKISINAQILTWKGKKPSKNIQSLARKKRYELLFKKCNDLKIYNILLGHHLDDLFENFFIRIFRGSGLKGLTSLNKSLQIDNINLLRPLLNFEKKDLIFLSKFIFNFYIQDPSNEDEKFLRIKIRKIINGIKKNGLDNRNFLKTINNLRSSDDVIKFYIRENLKQNSIFLTKKNQYILNGDFFHQPYEITFRALSEIIRFIGKKYYPSRGKKLDNIIVAIQKNSFSKLTLGGCVIEKINQTVIISKES